MLSSFLLLRLTTGWAVERAFGVSERDASASRGWGAGMPFTTMHTRTHASSEMVISFPGSTVTHPLAGAMRRVLRVACCLASIVQGNLAQRRTASQRFSSAACRCCARLDDWWMYNYAFSRRRGAPGVSRWAAAQKVYGIFLTSPLTVFVCGSHGSANKRAQSKRAQNTVSRKRRTQAHVNGEQLPAAGVLQEN